MVSLSGFWEVAQSYFYTIVIGLVILLIGFGLGVLVKKLLSRILKEIELNRIMKRMGLVHNLESTISNIVSYLIYLITIVFFLNQLGITSVVLYLIVGAILMLAILTFLVGMKDVIPNFVAWIILQKKGKIIEGHRIDIREISGRVVKFGFLETEIKTDSGDILYVPNNLFIKSKLKVKK